MGWFRSLWALTIVLAIYLVPMAFHFDAVAALAGPIGAWATVGLYFIWGVVLGVIAAKRESAVTFILTIWPGLLLVATSIGSLLAGNFVVLVIYALIYGPAVLILGAAAVRDLLDIAARRSDAQHLSTTQRLGFTLVFSVALVPLAMCIHHRYPTLFAGASLEATIAWWLFYVDLLADALTFGFLGTIDARFSVIGRAGFFDGALWWLSRTLLDVLLIAAVLDKLRSGRQRLSGTLIEL